LNFSAPISLKCDNERKLDVAEFLLIRFLLARLLGTENSLVFASRGAFGSAAAADSVIGLFITVWPR
jgi:hypothetical protein